MLFLYVLSNDLGFNGFLNQVPFYCSGKGNSKVQCISIILIVSWEK